ncbi:hypothetical protein BMETH_1458_0 [methanotrophic bacterial endosymbiont of Bathymodiolus sp.]|nr:hypothetical protein BMETH_1458_0 [methanotrophic bacterial endosymbiont of Bathymodiolus sp.]
MLHSFKNSLILFKYGSVARVVGSGERLVFRQNYSAKAINCL